MSGQAPPPNMLQPPERQVYQPSVGGQGAAERPGTASMPIRPVSAATWNRAMSGECRRPGTPASPSH